MDEKALISINRHLLDRSLNGCHEHDRFSGHVMLTVQLGDGEAVGQVLRRALLTSVPGSAVTGLRVSYVERSAGGHSGLISHAYARIPGVVENVRQIMANLSHLTLRLHRRERLVHTAHLPGPCAVRARDIFNHPNIELLSPEAHIARITGEVDVVTELTIARDIGFRQARVLPGQDVYLLPVDARFQSVRRVGVRIGARSQNQQQIEWTIETRGDVSPCEAWAHAVRHVLQESDR